METLAVQHSGKRSGKDGGQGQGSELRTGYALQDSARILAGSPTKTLTQFMGVVFRLAKELNPDSPTASVRLGR
jgi:hypothetical protein